ncbi:MAG: aldo/keto reductase [Gemmatimonadota bacterium]
MYRTMDMDIMTTVELNHGGPMPLFGLGTFRSPEGQPTRDAVRAALDAGYRHIDTAAIYGNETDVGAAVREHDVPREDIFITTKLAQSDHGYETALREFKASLERLGLEYVDLYLVHWPGGGPRNESWRALEVIREEGRARAIGVSNYTVAHLREVLQKGDAVPAVNQFELHPFNYASRKPIVDFCREHDVVVEGYSPLTKARRLDDPTVRVVAEQHGRTSAQVLIRWALQHRIVTIPKSASPDRIRENAGVFDFELSAEEMDRLDGLDEDFTTSWDPRTVD